MKGWENWNVLGRGQNIYKGCVCGGACVTLGPVKKVWDPEMEWGKVLCEPSLERIAGIRHAGVFMILPFVA